MLCLYDRNGEHRQQTRPFWRQPYTGAHLLVNSCGMMDTATHAQAIYPITTGAALASSSSSRPLRVRCRNGPLRLRAVLELELVLIATYA